MPWPAKARMAASAKRLCFFGDEYHSISERWVGSRGAVIACWPQQSAELGDLAVRVDEDDPHVRHRGVEGPVG